MRVPSGQPNAAITTKLSGKWYEFPDNDRGIKAVSFDFNAGSPEIVVRTAGGETKTLIGMGSWKKTPGGFANGIDKFLSVPAHPLIAASGGWSEADVFTLKIVPYQTPFYSTMSFRFDGDRLLLDSEYNVAFGPTKLPQLIGQATLGK